LVEALVLADRVVLAEVYRQEKLLPEERLRPEAVVENLCSRGVPAESGGSAEQIVESLAPRLETGDVVLTMSNGAFGGIHNKLVEALSRRPKAERAQIAG
jgi:UDP-N-acetylmuramate: L-alanyl-gamma-D-glutamyl-meso-diaminopimelate ligase